MVTLLMHYKSPFLYPDAIIYPTSYSSVMVYNTVQILAVNKVFARFLLSVIL